jgi:hypothetical protein
VNRQSTPREAKLPAAEAADAIRALLQSNSDQGPIQSLRGRTCTFLLCRQYAYGQKSPEANRDPIANDGFSANSSQDCISGHGRESTLPVTSGGFVASDPRSS